ncbi:MAG: protein phosphatase 2C domain-containing protein [Lentisphaeraceae bacterium]|nr:protein phosphatase 2C domain-containing protein [Lentisphaeraceae bacterium]
MQIKGTGLTDIGVIREQNEDYHFIDDELGLYIVCDGVGGAQGGEVASKLAAETCANFIRENQQTIEEYYCLGNNDSLVRNLLRSAILESCQTVYNEGLKNRDLAGMSTTLSAVLILNSKVVLGHVGDSRLYLIRNNQIFQATEDHTIGQEMRERSINFEGKKAASRFDSVLKRSIGYTELVEVDTMVFDLVPNDKLLLCSDGFYNYISCPLEIIPMTKENSEKNLKTMINFAIHRGGRDNITCILIETSLEEKAYEGLESDRSELLSNLSILDNYLFKDLNFIRTNRLLSHFDTYELAEGEEICEKGQSPHGLFIVFSGEVHVFENEDKQFGTLKKGQFFGQFSLMMEKREKYTYKAGKNCRTIYLSSDSYRTLCRNHPKFGVKLLENFIHGCEGIIASSLPK